MKKDRAAIGASAVVMCLALLLSGEGSGEILQKHHGMLSQIALQWNKDYEQHMAMKAGAVLPEEKTAGLKLDHTKMIRMVRLKKKKDAATTMDSSGSTTIICSRSLRKKMDACAASTTGSAESTTTVSSGSQSGSTVTTTEPVMSGTTTGSAESTTTVSSGSQSGSTVTTTEPVVSGTTTGSAESTTTVSSGSQSLSSFIENVLPQKIAQDGMQLGAFGMFGSGPQFGNNKIFVTYFDITSDPHNIFALQYEYATGRWTKALVGTVPATGNDIHNAPTIFRAPSGYLDVFYGAVACGFVNGDYSQGKANGPCYRRSIMPDSIAAWGPEQRVPMPGGMDSLTGGYDSRGYLHLFGEGDSGHLSYIRRDPNGAWTVKIDFIRSFTFTTDSSPGCAFNAKIAPDNTIHLVWAASTNYCSGSTEGLYYAKSKDFGETWTNVDGTASFTRTSGLSQIARYFFPVSYLVRSGGGLPRFQVEQLSDGTVIIAEGNGVPVIWTWTGAVWQSTRVDTVPNTSIGLVMETMSNDEIRMFSLGLSDGALYEYGSTDRGATWRKSILYTRSQGEELNDRLLGIVARPAGQKERVLLQWNQHYNRSAQPPVWHSEVMFLDRPR